MTTKIKIQLGAIAVLLIVALSLIISQTASPDFPPFWGLKRIQEKIYLKLKSNPNQKLDYMSFQLDRRLQELKSQVERQSYGYILPSASRYSTLAGEITDMILTNNMKDKVVSITNQFKEHQKVLYDIYVIYPKNTDNMEYKYIEDDIYYLKLYLDKLSNFFKAEKA